LIINARGVVCQQLLSLGEGRESRNQPVCLDPKATRFTMADDLPPGAMPPFPPSNSPHTPPTTQVVVDLGPRIEIAPPAAITDLTATLNADLPPPKARPNPPTNVRVTTNYDPPAPRKRRQRARTTIGRALLRNSTEIDIFAASFIGLIDERIAALREQRLNSSESVEDYERLRQRVQDFIDSKAGFVAARTSDAAVKRAAKVFARTLSDWWAKHGDTASSMIVFGFGVGICKLAGAGGDITVAVSGALAGGKPVADMLAALLNRKK
jgi:hypothetical protein